MSNDVKVVLKNSNYCQIKPGENQLINSGIENLPNGVVHTHIKTIRGAYLGHTLNSIKIRPNNSSNGEDSYHFDIKMKDIHCYTFNNKN